MMPIRTLFLLLLVAAPLAVVRAADPPAPPLSPERGGVGVVMSGGGAKGLYHVGVLEALEESGVPIDYVAGTSMGSIVAAMYAAGYSPAEMRAIVRSGLWARRKSRSNSTRTSQAVCMRLRSVSKRRKKSGKGSRHQIQREL